MAEFLVPVPPEKTVPIVEQISQSFKVVPFDLAVAEKYASLWHTVGKSEKPSPKVKLDLMIIWTALSEKCDILYSHDEDILRIGKGVIEVSEMLEILRQDTRI